MRHSRATREHKRSSIPAWTALVSCAALLATLSLAEEPMLAAFDEPVQQAESGQAQNTPEFSDGGIGRDASVVELAEPEAAPEKAANSGDATQTAEQTAESEGQESEVRGESDAEPLEKVESDTAVVAAEPVEQAENVELDKPIIVSAEGTESTVTSSVERSDQAGSDLPAASKENDSDTTLAEGAERDRQRGSDEKTEPFLLLGKEIAAGTSTRLAWTPSASFPGIAADTPVLAIHGQTDGPVLCLTAALHGDELNGIEIVRRVMYDIEPEKLKGAVIGVPIVNLQGFRRSSRYLTDRRDLNRYFPGNPNGSSASRIAYSFFKEVISHCDALVDLHTGSFHRTNLPQLRANLYNEDVRDLSRKFGATVVLHSQGAKGTLRRAAVEAGIPSVTLEAGEPLRLQDKEVSHGVKAVQTLLDKLGMYKRASFWGKPEPVFYKSTWVRADQGGILFSDVFLGKRVREGDLLGSVTDPITNVRADILSPSNGRVLGMALNQFVQPGFAAFRIGIETPAEEMDEPAPEERIKGTDSADRKAKNRADLAQQGALLPEPESGE